MKRIFIIMALLPTVVLADDADLAATFAECSVIYEMGSIIVGKDSDEGEVLHLTSNGAMMACLYFADKHGLKANPYCSNRAEASVSSLSILLRRDTPTFISKFNACDDLSDVQGAANTALLKRAYAK